MKCSLGFAALAVLLPFSSPTRAADWPVQNVRVIVPYSAGSTPDTIARLIFDRVQKETGKTFVIENRSGAGGMIGVDIVAKAKPDGHTLALAPMGPLAINALLYKKMPYDPVRDLAPVTLVAETPSIWVTSKEASRSSVADLLKAMGDSGERMAYASPGAGTLAHLSMAYLVSYAKAADIPHAPYGGSPQIVTALIANDVQMAALPPQAVAPHIKSGRISAIATLGPRRSAALPDVPTLKERGIDFQPVGWFGVVATAGTSAEVLDVIHRYVTNAMSDAAVVASYASQGLELADKGPGAFSEYIREEVARWKPVIEDFNISLD